MILFDVIANHSHSVLRISTKRTGTVNKPYTHWHCYGIQWDDGLEPPTPFDILNPAHVVSFADMKVGKPAQVQPDNAKPEATTGGDSRPAKPPRGESADKSTTQDKPDKTEKAEPKRSRPPKQSAPMKPDKAPDPVEEAPLPCLGQNTVFKAKAPYRGNKPPCGQAAIPALIGLMVE